MLVLSAGRLCRSAHIRCVSLILSRSYRPRPSRSLSTRTDIQRHTAQLMGSLPSIPRRTSMLCLSACHPHTPALRSLRVMLGRRNHPTRRGHPQGSHYQPHSLTSRKATRRHHNQSDPRTSPMETLAARLWLRKRQVAPRNGRTFHIPHGRKSSRGCKPSAYLQTPNWEQQRFTSISIKMKCGNLWIWSGGAWICHHP